MDGVYKRSDSRLVYGGKPAWGVTALLLAATYLRVASTLAHMNAAICAHASRRTHRAFSRRHPPYLHSSISALRAAAAAAPSPLAAASKALGSHNIALASGGNSAGSIALNISGEIIAYPAKSALRRRGGETSVNIIISVAKAAA